MSSVGKDSPGRNVVKIKSHERKNSSTTTSSGDVRQQKLQIMQYNPMIYNMFREYLNIIGCYTDFTVCSILNHFLDNVVRIPEFRSDIINHRLVHTNQHRYRNSNSNTATSIYAYLTGESLSSSYSSPYSSPTSVTRLTPTTSNLAKSNSDTLSQFSQELILPSLNFFAYLSSEK
jgi:hypothetical protein